MNLEIALGHLLIGPLTLPHLLYFRQVSSKKNQRLIWIQNQALHA